MSISYVIGLRSYWCYISSEKPKSVLYKIELGLKLSSKYLECADSCIYLRYKRTFVVYSWLSYVTQTTLFNIKCL